MMGLEILASRGGNAPTSDTEGIKASERLLPSHFGRQERRGVTLLAQVIDPSHQEKIKLLIHNGSREDYIWPPCGPLGHLSVVLSPILTSCGQPEAKRWNYFSKSFVFLNDVNGKKVGPHHIILCTQVCTRARGNSLNQQFWLLFCPRLCVRHTEEGVQ